MSNNTIHIKRTGAAEYGKFIKALVCGNPGAGKTLWSSTWPDPIFLSAEGGLMSIADRHIPYVDITSTADLNRMKIALSQDPETVEGFLGFPVQTVVIDTIDEIQRILIRERLEETGKDSVQLQDWSYLAEHMAAIVRGFRQMSMNVIFTCHVKEVTDSTTGQVTYKPQMQGQYADQIAAQVDLAMLLKTVTKTELIDNKPEKVVKRILQTNPDTTYEWIKDRSGKLDREVEVNFTDDYQRIWDAIYNFGVMDMDDHESVTEIQVPLAELPKIPSAAEANVRAKRGRPALPKRPTATPAPKATTPSVEPVAESVANQATPEPEPEIKAVTELVEEPTVEPVKAERTDGIIVRNPIPTQGEGPDDMFQPAKTLKLVNKGYGTDCYCQTCGGEVENMNRVKLSCIRFRKCLDDACFEDMKRPAGYTSPKE